MGGQLQLAAVAENPCPHLVLISKKKAAKTHLSAAKLAPQVAPLGLIGTVGVRILVKKLLPPDPPATAVDLTQGGDGSCLM